MVHTNMHIWACGASNRERERKRALPSCVAAWLLCTVTIAIVRTARVLDPANKRNDHDASYNNDDDAVFCVVLHVCLLRRVFRSCLDALSLSLLLALAWGGLGVGFLGGWIVCCLVCW